MEDSTLFAFEFVCRKHLEVGELHRDGRENRFRSRPSGFKPPQQGSRLIPNQFGVASVPLGSPLPNRPVIPSFDPVGLLEGFVLGMTVLS